MIISQPRCVPYFPTVLKNCIIKIAKNNHFKYFTSCVINLCKLIVSLTKLMGKKYCTLMQNSNFWKYTSVYICKPVALINELQVKMLISIVMINIF